MLVPKDRRVRWLLGVALIALALIAIPGAGSVFAGAPAGLPKTTTVGGKPVSRAIIAATSSKKLPANLAKGSVTQKVGPMSFSDMAPLTTRRGREAVATDGNSIFAIGGETYDGTNYVQTATVERYNPSTNTYTTLAPLPQAYSNIEACAMNGKIYVPGGYDTAGTANPIMYVYSIIANTWSTPSSIPGTATLWYNAVCDASANKLYVIGGYDTVGAAGTTANYIYDATANTWSTGAPLPAARYGSEAGLINGNIYVATGSVNGVDSTDVQKYNIATNTWTAVAPMAVSGLFGTSSVSDDGKLYVAGGGFNGGLDNYLTRVEKYDPVANIWSTLTDTLNVPVRHTNGGFAGTAGSRNLFVLGGNSVGVARCTGASGSIGVCDHTQKLLEGAPTNTPSPTATPQCLDYAIVTGTDSISPASTLVAGSQADDAVAAVSLPFPVLFYGTYYSTAQVSTNGNMQFTTSSSALSNTCLPASATVGASLMPHWDDLDLRTTITTTFVPGIYTSVSGAPGSQVYNVEWHGCLYSSGSCGGEVDFEARFYENQPQIDVVYGTVSGGGISATSGVENSAGTQYTQFECNTGGLTSGLKITYSPFILCQTPTITNTPTRTFTSTPTLTPVLSNTPSNTNTRTNTATITNTPTRTNTITPTQTVAACGVGGPYNLVTATATIAAGVTDIGNHGDDTVTTIALPFPVAFYGQSFSSVGASSNGSLQFSSSSTSFSNVALPTSTFNNAILPYWDDLRTDGTTGEGIFTSITGAAPNRTFNIEWRACIRTSSACTAVDTNFEVQLFETAPAVGPDFNMIYGAMSQNGSGATVGVQKGTGSTFTQFSLNTASLSNGLLISGYPRDCSVPTGTSTSTPTVTATFTASSTPTNTSTPTATQTPPACGPGGPYNLVTATATIVAGVNDIGNHSDDNVTTIALPFPVAFYGQSFSSVGAGANGNLQFSSSSTGFSNTALPTSSFNNAILPYWDDLRTDGTTGEGIFTSITGVAPNRTFNIEWRACTWVSGGCTAIDTNFEVQLFETAPAGGPDFNVIYGAMSQNGSGATVGVQKGLGVTYTQFSFNTASLSNGLLISGYPRDCAVPTQTSTSTATLTITPTLTATATAYPTCGVGSDYTISQSSSVALIHGTTLVAGSQADDAAVPITAPFALKLYGLSFNSIYASTNGNLQFASSNSTFSNACLPSSTVNYLVAPHWDDQDLTATLVTTYTPGIFTSVVGSAPTRDYIIEWHGCLYGGGSCGGEIDYEVRFHENSDQIDMVYGTMTNSGTSATVGIQRAAGLSNTQFECNTGGINPGLELSFAPASCVTNTPTATPTDTPTFTVTATSTATNTSTPTLTPTPGNILIAHVTLQGVAQPSVRNNQTITLTLCVGGAPQTFVQTLDNSGFFTVTTALPNGSYNWRVKTFKDLANANTLTFTGGTLNVEMGLLRAGDTDNNNIVNTTDFNRLKTAFGTSSNPFTDFNNDGITNTTDFNLLKGTFGSSGAAANCP